MYSQEVRPLGEGRHEALGRGRRAALDDRRFPDHVGHPAAVTRAAVEPPTSYYASAQGMTIVDLIAPGYDHELVDDAAEHQALQARYADAYQNEVDPFTEIQ